MSADLARALIRRYSAEGLLTEIMHGLVIFSVLIIPVRFFIPADTAAFIFWTAAAYLLLWLLRHLLNHIWQYVILAGVIISIPVSGILMLSPLFKLFLVTAYAFMLLRTFILRMNQDKDKPAILLSAQALALFFLIALNILAVRLRLYEVSKAYFYLAVIYLILAIIRWHTISLDEHMARFDSMPTQPAHMTRRFSQLLLLVFSLFLLGILLLAPVLRLHELLPMLGSAALVLLRWLLNLLFTEREPEPADPDPGPKPGSPIDDLPFEPSEPAAWLLILQDIIYYLFIAFSILAFFMLLVYILYRIYRRFYESQSGPDVAESLIPRWTEDIKEKVDKTRTRWRDHFSKSPEQQIRRIYYKAINRLMRKGLKIKSGFSPRKFAGWLMKEKNIDILVMTYIYEKARYGSGECSETEVGRMQELYREFRRYKITGPGKDDL